MFIMKLFTKFFGLLLVIATIYMIVSYKYENIPFKNETYKSYVTAGNVDRMLDCLTTNIYNEAASEPFEGKLAVAQVTLNRVDHPKFPKDVCKVVYEKNIFMEKVVCQFSWYCMKVPKINKESDEYQESLVAAKKVLLEGFRLDGLKSAIFYHADYITKPNWNNVRKITKIGRHIFYEQI